MRIASLGICLLLAVLLAVPQTAAAFVSRKGDRVNPVSEDVFEVVPKGGGAGFRYWCAGGEYARRVLKAPWTAEVYIYRGLGPSETTGRRSAVQFTLHGSLAGRPPGGGPRSINSLVAGDSMSVQQANGFCNELPTGF